MRYRHKVKYRLFGLKSYMRSEKAKRITKADRDLLKMFLRRVRKREERLRGQRQMIDGNRLWIMGRWMTFKEWKARAEAIGKQRYEEDKKK